MEADPASALTTITKILLPTTTKASRILGYTAKVAEVITNGRSEIGAMLSEIAKLLESVVNRKEIPEITEATETTETTETAVPQSASDSDEVDLAHIFGDEGSLTGINDDDDEEHKQRMVLTRSLIKSIEDCLGGNQKSEFTNTFFVDNKDLKFSTGGDSGSLVWVERDDKKIEPDDSGQNAKTTKKLLYPIGIIRGILDSHELTVCVTMVSIMNWIRTDLHLNLDFCTHNWSSHDDKDNSAVTN
eukprot:TRINITY_DN954_c0_g2_i2.p1 TRINITY_DN954_c0_g2~~TRINITY_DN954_c0_g2_i2.p1  ORF type:complete len:245 (+),score=47.81 TRINITY_DN954_c0_g2_i2:623-1357(+)